MTPPWPASWSSPRRWPSRRPRRTAWTPRDELALYIVHGLLHLCGYDDSTESDTAEMRRREDEVLTEFGYTNPWGVGN